MHFAINIIISTVFATMSGLGIGGGSLLLLWLTLVEEMDYASARLLNLLFFIPPALLSCISCRKVLKHHRAILIPAIFAGTLSAFLFSILSRNWDTSLLRKLFGILLLAAGIQEFRK